MAISPCATWARSLALKSIKNSYKIFAALVLACSLTQPLKAQSLDELQFNQDFFRNTASHYYSNIQGQLYIVFVRQSNIAGDVSSIYAELAIAGSLADAPQIIAADISRDGDIFASMNLSDLDYTGKITLYTDNYISDTFKVDTNGIQAEAPPLQGNFCGVDQLCSLPPSRMSPSGFVKGSNFAFADCGSNPLPVPTISTITSAFSETQLGTREIGITEDENVAELDLLVAYTDQTMAAAGSEAKIKTFMTALLLEANQIFRRSGSRIRLRLVGFHRLPGGETGIGLTDLVRVTERDGFWDTVHDARQQTGADIVTLLEDQYLKEIDGSSARPLCGLGWIMRPGTPSWAKDKAFNIFAGLFSGDNLGSCGARVFAHEIGHNLGLDHDHFHTAGGGAFLDSYGYRFYSGNNLFVTIMSYLDPAEFSYGRLLNYFSNSEIFITGQPIGQVDYANEAHSLNRVADFVANHTQRRIINVSGNVMNGTLGLPGANILLNGSPVARSGLGGNFSFQAPGTGPLTISISSPTQIFFPERMDFIADLTDLKDLRFTLQKDLVQPPQGFYRISPVVLIGDQELPGVQIFVNGIELTERDINGNLYIDVPIESTNSVTVFHPDYSFVPPSYLVDKTSVTNGLVFTANLGTNWVTGYVRQADGLGAMGVEVAADHELLDFEGRGRTTTLSNGFFRFLNAQQGVQYLLTPRSLGNHFFPPQAAVLVDETIERVNFKLIPGSGDTISGTVNDQNGNPVPGASVYLTCHSSEGDFTVSGIVTDTNGYFEVNGLPVGSICNVQVSKEGYIFPDSPAPSGGGPNGSNINLVGQRLRVTLSGRVLDENAQGLSGILIRTEKGPLYSASDGSFSHEAEINKIATLMPSSARHYFVPAFYQWNVGGKDSSGNDFVAQAISAPVDSVTIVGNPGVVTSGNGDDAYVETSVYFVNPNGSMISVKWQLRRALRTVERKLVFAKWKAIKGETGPKIRILKKKLKPGIYEVRAAVKEIGTAARPKYSKPARFKVTSGKKKASK